MGKRKRIPDHANTQPPSGTFFKKNNFYKFTTLYGLCLVLEKMPQKLLNFIKVFRLIGQKFSQFDGFFFGGGPGVYDLPAFFTQYFSFFL